MSWSPIWMMKHGGRKEVNGESKLAGSNLKRMSLDRPTNGAVLMSLLCHSKASLSCTGSWSKVRSPALRRTWSHPCDQSFMTEGWPCQLMIAGQRFYHISFQVIVPCWITVPALLCNIVNKCGGRFLSFDNLIICCQRCIVSSTKRRCTSFSLCCDWRDGYPGLGSGKCRWYDAENCLSTYPKWQITEETQRLCCECATAEAQVYLYPLRDSQPFQMLSAPIILGVMSFLWKRIISSLYNTTAGLRRLGTTKGIQCSVCLCQMRIRKTWAGRGSS